MQFTIQVVIKTEHGSEVVKDIIQFNKDSNNPNTLGITLTESKSLMKALQQNMISHQTKHYLSAQQTCRSCHQKRRLKGYHPLQYRTLFGIVSIDSPRWFSCGCHPTNQKTFSPLSRWLKDKNSHELQYIETKWSSLVSYQMTANLLKNVFPIGETENASSIRNHLVKIAKKQEQELEGKPEYMNGCQNEWASLPKPDKPMTVGIDGGYLKSWRHKNKNFEIIAGKSYSKTQSSKRFGFVQSIDKKPRRRLMNLLSKQGMQANQQVTFLSDGADNVRDLQYMMYPESEHVLDWFHITMRMTVLNQFAKGLIRSDPKIGEQMSHDLESIKWYLWHGNVINALERIEDCYINCLDDEIKYRNLKKLIKHLEDLATYVENNAYLIPNYGEKWRYGEAISTAFVESTINEVVAKRMVKKQQMQWTPQGAHYLLQTRIAVLNNDLPEYFNRWYPGFHIKHENTYGKVMMKKAA